MLSLVLTWGCSPKPEQALASALGPDFRRDERLWRWWWDVLAPEWVGVPILEVHLAAFEAGEFQDDHQVADFLAGGDVAHREGNAGAGVG